MAKAEPTVRVLYGGPSASVTVDSVEIPPGAEATVTAAQAARLLTLEGHTVSVLPYADFPEAWKSEDEPAEDAVAGSAAEADLPEGDVPTPE